MRAARIRLLLRRIEPQQRGREILGRDADGRREDGDAGVQEKSDEDHLGAVDGARILRVVK